MRRMDGSELKSSPRGSQALLRFTLNDGPKLLRVVPNYAVGLISTNSTVDPANRGEFVGAISDYT
jgi:hypothetical protein